MQAEKAGRQEQIRKASVRLRVYRGVVLKTVRCGDAEAFLAPSEGDSGKTMARVGVTSRSMVIREVLGWTDYSARQ